MADTTIFGFDIKGYATDPGHIKRIQGMAEFISLHIGDSGNISDPKDCQRLDTYMKLRAPKTPLSGEMLLSARDRFGIGNEGVHVMMALIQNDSLYGTRGEGARLHNPGNVGDFDNGETRDWGTWQAGVDAVARWLDTHRVKA